MSFAIDYLAQLETLCARARPPAVRSLHLPPDPPPGTDRGEFCAVELADGTLGLSYVLLDDTLRRSRAHAPSLGLEGAEALAVARGYAAGDEGPASTIGFAVANALTRWFYDRCGFVAPDSVDSTGGLAPQPGEAVGMIGYFPPLVPTLTATGAQLHIVERDPAKLAPVPGASITQDPTVLHGCRDILATGTLLLNGTLDSMLAHCRHARRLALIGPSVGCLPDALFARGVTCLGGTWVTDAAGFADTLRRGERRGHTARKFALEPGSYPGFEALLARLS